MEIEEGNPPEGAEQQPAEKASESKPPPATTPSSAPSPASGQPPPNPAPLQPPLLGTRPPPQNFLPPHLPPGLMAPPHHLPLMTPPMDPAAPLPLPLPAAHPIPEPVKPEPTGPRPVATVPIPGTPWSVVWTSDDRQFFFNATKNLSVWTTPSDLVGSDSLKQILEDPPVTGKSEDKVLMSQLNCLQGGAGLRLKAAQSLSLWLLSYPALPSSCSVK